MAKIGLKGIEIHAHHGVYESEKQLGNDFLVDLEVETLDQLPGSDELDDTIDYAELHALVVATFEGSLNLLETLVKRIGSEVMLNYPGVNKVNIKVSKLNPPLDGKVHSSYVQAEFSRDQ